MQRRVSVHHLAVLVPILGVVVSASRAIRDSSFLWHVRAGTHQLDLGEVIREDPFSFSAAGEGWRTQSWITELTYGVLERWTGDLIWVWPMLALVMGATLFMVAAAVYRKVPIPLNTAFVVFFSAWLSLRNLVPRPVLFSYLFLAALVLLVGERRLRWAIPLLLWVWAGAHGTFVIGLGLIILEAIRQRSRALWGSLGLSVVAVSLTAHGLALWVLLIDFLQNRSALDLIQEWQPPRLTNLPIAPYVLLLLGVVVAATLGKIKPRDLIVVAPFLIFGLTSNRALFPATIVVAPWAALALPAWRSPRKSEAYLVNAMLGALLIFSTIVIGLGRNESKPSDDVFPVAAVEHLESGAIFHSDEVGGFLIYETWPDHLVYTDDRAELYGRERFEQFIQAFSGHLDWVEVFAKYDIEQVLIPVDDTPLEQLLANEGWFEGYRDEDYLILRPG